MKEFYVCVDPAVGGEEPVVSVYPRRSIIAMGRALEASRAEEGYDELPRTEEQIIQDWFVVSWGQRVSNNYELATTIEKMCRDGAEVE